MQKHILDYLKITALIFIAVMLFIINNNMRILGHSILSNSNEKEGNNIPQKINLSKSKGIFIGSKEAKLTITVFIDYECIFCKRFMEEVYPSIEKDYIKTNKIKIEFRNLPLSMHANASFAAKASICANNFNKFNDFHTSLFQERKDINETNIIKIALSMNIDKNKFLKCVNDTSTGNKIKYDIEECMRNGIQGTPTFVINGNVYTGLIPYNNFKTLIEDELGNKIQQDSKTCQ